MAIGVLIYVTFGGCVRVVVVVFLCLYVDRSRLCWLVLCVFCCLCVIFVVGRVRGL